MSGDHHALPDAANAQRICAVAQVKPPVDGNGTGMENKIGTRVARREKGIEFVAPLGFLPWGGAFPTVMTRDALVALPVAARGRTFRL